MMNEVGLLLMQLKTGRIKAVRRDNKGVENDDDNNDNDNDNGPMWTGEKSEDAGIRADDFDW